VAATALGGSSIIWTPTFGNPNINNTQYQVDFYTFTSGGVNYNVAYGQVVSGRLANLPTEPLENSVYCTPVNGTMNLYYPCLTFLAQVGNGQWYWFWQTLLISPPTSSTPGVPVLTPPSEPSQWFAVSGITGGLVHYDKAIVTGQSNNTCLIQRLS
jgi:hypothetical protein